MCTFPRQQKTTESPVCCLWFLEMYLPKFTDSGGIKMTPTTYSQEILQSSEKRLKKFQPALNQLEMTYTTFHEFSMTDVDQTIFQPYPPKLVFQNFTAGETYKLPLQLFNRDNISKYVKLELPETKYFHINGPENATGKVAPGLSANFTIVFTPQENKDYQHHLVCVSEKKSFEIPIVAIGPRAILDFRDELFLPVCPVKATSEKTVLVRNVGNCKANFKLKTKGPFSVTPSSGSMKVGESMQVTVTFSPVGIGDHRQELLLYYHTGEVVYISLFGSCEELALQLESKLVLLKKTYISLSSEQTVSLTNTSDVPLQYHWTTHSSRSKQDMPRGTLLHPREQQEAFLNELNPAIIHGSEPLSTAARDPHPDFSNDCAITLEPTAGEIWPNVTVEFLIIFKPETAGLHQQTLYCDVTGRESPLCLTIKGEGLGPKLEPSYSVMDMKDVCIGDKDWYEVILTNKGLIDAPFKMCSPDTTFGAFFSFTPVEDVVAPGDSQTVKVTFSSSVLGPFSEDLLLTVKGQPRPQTLNFRGCVNGPTFIFDVTELNFGDVAYGFPAASICTLFNQSFVPMTFSLRVLGDGSGPPSVSCVQQLNEKSRSQWQSCTAKDRHVRPKEFNVSPQTDCVRAMSQVTIKVMLCSNTVKTYKLALAVDVKGVGKKIKTLSLNARCVAPYLEVNTPVLDFKSCFLNLPYEQKVQLVNTSPFPACFDFFDQVLEESPSMHVQSLISGGVILPHRSEELPVRVIAKAVGRLHFNLPIAVIGSPHPHLNVLLSCNGQGPIVSVQRHHLDFGQIPVLKDLSKSLCLINQSPIPAAFSASMRQRKSFWHVEPKEGEVPANSQLELRVVAHLKDTLLFEDELDVSVQDSGTLTVSVKGIGTGYTLVSDKPFAPSLDLGAHFSHGLCQYHFKLTNLGLRTHRMYWRTDGSLDNEQRVNKSGIKTSMPPILLAKKKSLLLPRRSMGSSGLEGPVFSLTPSRVELFPGQSVDMVLKGLCSTPRVVNERLVCHSIVGNSGSWDSIMSVDVTCCFVAPMLSISSKQLHFYLKKVAGKSVLPQYKKVLVKNLSTLTLFMNLQTSEPFGLCHEQGSQNTATSKMMTLEEGKQAELWVCLNPGFCEDRVSRVLDEVLQLHYQGHPQQDIVELHGEIHFPNLLLSSTSVDFGCVLNSTEAQREITITNCSPLPVAYHWTFLDQKPSGPRELDEQSLSLEDVKRHSNEDNENTLSSASSRPFSPVSTENQQRRTYSPVKVEETFDVLPIHCHLQPGEQQVTAFSFFGHEYMSREVVALCHVEDGPVYDVTLKGEASQVSFSLDRTCLDFGQKLFDYVGEDEIILKNTGKVGFNFKIWRAEQNENTNHEPSENILDVNSKHEKIHQNDEDNEIISGEPWVFPSKGFVEANTAIFIRILYLPGVPEKFEKRLQLQVACLPPQEISVVGEGVFPQINLNLPRNNSQNSYSKLLKQAEESLKTNEHLEGFTNESKTEGSTETSYTPRNKELLEMEMERIIVKQNSPSVTAKCLKLKDLQGPSRCWSKITKCLLPEYILDFGSVILGRTPSQTVHINNSGPVTVSLTANPKVLVGTGFSMEFEKVKDLPCGETHDFTVKFDPKEAKLPLGSVCVVLPIQVRGGPTVQVQLCAVVTKPDITVSTEILEFDTITSSMCQIKAVQLFNHECVPCQWSMAEEVKLKKVNKFLPFSKQKQQRPPVVFEMVPNSGVLSPGERVNVLVKFTPLEEEFYSNNLVVSVAESSQTILIKAQGQGVKPRLDFPTQAFTKPCLPYSTNVETKVTVRNPCSFPIEFYCLEQDNQYLEEDRILRLMQGYDENNKLLLPPRIPGEGLPQELLDFYQHYASDFTNNDNYTECDKQMLQTGNIGYKNASTALEKAGILLSEINKGLHKELGHLQLDPVSRAITRHMGLDLSPESLAALNRRGIAIIVYGAPKTDIGSTAVSLAQYYGAMLLSIDAVVTEELLEGTSPAALAARQLLEQAAAEISKSLRDTSKSLEKTKENESAGAEVLDKSSSSSCNGELRDTKTDNITLLLGGDMTSLKTLLPESVLIDILTERFQSSDCHRGIVIDGLKSVFTATVAHTLQVLLKVLNNRKHIYVINIYDSYSALQNREKEQKDAEEAQQQDMAKHEKQWLQELDEDEYDALSEEKKHIIEQHRLRLTKDQIRISKEQEQQRQLEDSKRHIEEQKKNSKKGLKKDPSKKEPNEIANQLMSRQNSRETLGENRLMKTFKDGPSNYPNHDQTEETKEMPINAEKLDKLSANELQTEFIAFEQSQVQVEHILQHWDRVQGILLVPFPVEDAPGAEEGMPEKITPVGKGKGKKANYKVSKYSQIENTEDKLCPTDAIPHIVVNTMEKDCTVFPKPLPSLEEVLDELGLGPSGPPIPPSAIFSLASFPPNRILSQLNNKYFTFLDPSEQDEQENDSLLWDVAPTQKAPKKGRGCKDPQPLKDKKIREATKTSGKTSRNTSSVTSLCNEDQHQLNVELKRNQSLTNFRWIVPANGEVTLRIWFYSETPGIFEQKFCFEMAGTQTQWQLLCKGMCSYPCISKDYMTLFPYSKKVQHVKDDLHKTYIIQTGYFEFGPLLCSKTRDSYKESKYPDNMETLVINNPSGIDAEIQFSFKNDTQATTYLLEPPTMTLKPDESQELKIWAYPTKVGQIKDSIVCHIKDNNEPVVIDVSCWGVRPELELDTKSLPFDKTIIHRRVSRTLNLHNKTAVHVSWRLQGIDDLGDSFNVPQDQGIVPPYSTFPLTLHFRAKKPLHTKKTIRLEVSDVEKILGIVHTENITVSAEAYDVSINIEPDSLDFGTMKVFSDAKTTLKIQNHGKYEIAYRFTLDTTNPKLPNLDSLFCISPRSGKVMPHDKSVTVQIICKPKTDICIKEKPILHCQVIEPNIGERGETIVTFVTKVSIQAVFSRYRITPTCDINFGPLIFGGKKTKPFIIENTGVFETRFSISCMIAQSPERGKKPPLDLTNRHNAVGGKVKPEYMQKDMCLGQTRLMVGVFSVHPCTAVVLPGSQQVVTVECSGDELGSFDQGLIIDICDRDPSDHPDGIPYKLLAEVYKTGILLDPTSIFEEHVICHSSHQLSSELFANANSVYVTEEKKFYFNKVLVGQTANARFKLTNNSKVPCNLNVAIRSIGPKIDKIQIQEEIFNVSPMTLLIPGQSQCFAEVTFTPLAMTIYHGVFEATMDGGSRGTPTIKIKMLEFDIIGEGVLPNVQVIHPTLKNSSGDPQMQFRNSLIGQRKTQTFVLLNDGNAPAQLQIDMPDKDGMFTLNAAAGNDCCSISTVILESSADAEPQSAYRTLAHLNVKEKVEFEVSFCSTKDQKCHTNVYIKDCQYIDLIISVIGEASKEIVSLENITRPLLETDQIFKNGIYEMDFGDCHVNATYQESFTLVNHSRDKGLRFEWALPAPQVRFSPQEGYVHSGCSVEVLVSFCSSQPITLTSKPMKCKLTQVVFKESLELCDDQQKTPLSSATPSPLPATKVLKSAPDPSYSVVDGWHLDLELRVSAVCDVAKFSFSTSIVKFEDTMLYQTSLQSLLISNEGNVGLAFSWTVEIDHAQTADKTVTNGSSSGSSNAETRPSSTTESVVSLLRMNPELVPFTVEPSEGMIKPWATQEFTILFSPLEVCQFEGTIKCSIHNLQKKDQPPSVSVCGRSMMPNYHFDLEDSDYISGGSRNSESRIPIDSQTRVVEFIAVGLATKSTRSFFVLNPTNMSYSFKWRCEDASESSFQCLTPSGILQPKEKAEICLAYVSEQMDIVESLWSFVIDALSVSVPFLFVGITRTPRVYLEKALINFKSLLVGNKAEETVHLVNGEDEPFDFSVLQQSLVCDDKLSSLAVQPMSGFLRPKERYPLSLSFAPHHEGYLSFRVFLKVKRILEPLALTVKAECIFMATLVQVQNPTGGLRELRPNHVDSLDFQKVGISEQSSFLFLVSNLAQCELYITFDIAGPSNLLQHLKLEPKHATVEVGKQLQFSFFFCPLRICNLQDVRLSIKVKNGASFTIDVKGQGTAPSLDFSFTKHNFGKCLVRSPGMFSHSPSKTLVITNKGKRKVSIQCLFENTSYLEIGFQSSILASGADLKIPITFCPQEECCYQEKLDFVLNSGITRQVDILGQGIELKLEVEDPKHKVIDFKSLTLGKKVKKGVVLVNRSTVNLSFSLHLNSDTPLNPQDLFVTPTGQLSLKAGKSCVVEVHFYPREHVSKFTVEMQAETRGLLHPLLSIRGSCQGVEVHLDQNNLAFGPLVQNCKTSKKIAMMNTGEISAKFCWKTENFPTPLCIHPTKGSIGPGMMVFFEVVFAPVQLCDDCRFENLPCIVEGRSSPLTLTVTGSCVMASVKEVVNFICPVRSSHTQKLSVLNPTNQSCTVKPVIKGEHWRGAPVVVLEPLQNMMFEITYCPLTMTTDRKKHLGSVFFSFVDGTGLLYSLQGTAEAPKAEDTIVLELPAKTHHTELLPVHNWLLKQQQFCVRLEFLKPDKPDATVSLSGLDFIDVPALTKKDYKLSFHAYKTGQYNIKVTFHNEATGEYLFYLITFKISSSVHVQSTIELVTTVRQPVSATVHTENPLPTNVCLTTECKCADISVPLHHTVPGHSKDSLTFEYLPLHAGKTTARLTVSCNELGSFHYDLLLRALSPPLEKVVHFSASLGTSHSVTVKFTNFSRTRTEYSCKTDSPDFLVDKKVTAAAGLQSGSMASVDVCFEPHQLGEVKTQLTLHSPAGGEYIFPLHGVCDNPKPQGPFYIAAGRIVHIPFKNVFLQNTIFTYKVNNPSFTVKGPETIRSKRTENILVTFGSPPEGGSGPWFGRLTISSQPSDVHAKSCSWTFYLKGFRPVTP